VHLGTTHALGYMLGQRLFRSMLEGLASKTAIRNLFHLNFSDLDQAYTTYLDLISMSPAGGKYPGRRSRRPGRVVPRPHQSPKKNAGKV
jgi:hypothetical protein